MGFWLEVGFWERVGGVTWVRQIGTVGQVRV
jgi:hypothetical protein